MASPLPWTLPQVSPTTMNILIDDSDPLLQYSSPGGWSVTGEVLQFEQTGHASATLRLREPLSVFYGSIADGEARLDFSINGVVVGSYQCSDVDHAIHNQLFWTSPVLAETSHQLLVTVDQDSSMDSSDRSIFLHYFVYNTTSAVGKLVLFDNNDTSLAYSPDWQANTDSDSSLQGTEHVSMSAGAWVALSFAGTRILLFSP
ncbi:hypothetical protein K438DRAFT_1987838 [Mycena galopus ATCC 62051]|nr:hypothetical protein K438DRAFT_1987838 [Mycena galopus ATCC 62051]